MSTLAELNQHLFAQLQRLDVKEMTADEIDAEVKRTEAMVRVADRITENSKVVLAAARLYAEHRDVVLPYLPQIGKAVDK